jgi:hypothetical protein
MAEANRPQFRPRRYLHYLKQLAPVMSILEPVIRRLGYSIE